MANEELARALAALAPLDLAGALLSDLHDVCYVSGHEVPIEAGPSPFAGGPSFAVLDRAGQAGTLVVANVEAAAAQASNRLPALVTYTGFGYQEPADHLGNLWAALAPVLRQQVGARGRLGVERRTLPVAIAEAIAREFPGLELVECGEALARARQVKTEREIGLLRCAARLTDVGQAAARHHLAPGRSELALFGAVRTAMEEAAGRRIAVTGDLFSGRDGRFTAWPSARAIQPGDTVVVDLAPRLDGYWADSCNTLAVGEPSAEVQRLYRVAREALALGLEAVRPGRRAREIDAVCRGHLARHGFALPHHSGHAIGTSVHESPRLVPYDDTPLEENMVLLLEPGAYQPGVGSVRVEWLIRVTATGFERLSGYEHGL